MVNITDRSVLIDHQYKTATVGLITDEFVKLL